MDDELRGKLNTIEQKVDEMLAAERKRERHARIMLYINIAVIVLPLIGILALLPFLYSSLHGLYNF